MASNIDGKFQYLMETKSLIKSALNEKGLTITDADTFRSYADSIRNADFKSDDVRYVTFRNGTRQLYVKPVATGDDCVDVKAKGFITTPTKASTVDKVFTYSGWAATDGGVADEGVLKAVTEDKTVYAAYTESVRYYTITYYDSDGTTVLKTESLAYGATPVFAPEKDGFGFEGWSPEPTTVTENASYVAQWSELLTFANASWSQINEIAEAGETEKYFKIGDKKTLLFTYDGTTLNIPVVLAGIQHDDLASGGKANLSIVCDQAIVTIEPVATRPTTNEYRWTGSYLRERAVSFRGALPNDLKSIIKPVSKISKNGKSVLGQWQSGALVTTTDSIWYLSNTEVGFGGEEGTQYPIFTDDSSRKRRSVGDTSDSRYYLRSGDTQYAASVSAVDYGGIQTSLNHGKSTTVTAGKGYGLVFGFCI